MVAWNQILSEAFRFLIHLTLRDATFISYL